MTVTIEDLEKTVAIFRARMDVVDRAKDCRSAARYLAESMATLHALEPNVHLCGFSLHVNEIAATAGPV